MEAFTPAVASLYPSRSFSCTTRGMAWAIQCLLLAGVLLGATACGGDTARSQLPAHPGDGSAKTAAESESAELDRAIDNSILPGDDFFRYTNGIWLKNTAIPPDRSSYGVGSMLFDRAQQRTRELMERAAAANAAAGSDERKIGYSYASDRDEQAIEKKGLEPLRETLNSI